MKNSIQNVYKHRSHKHPFPLPLQLTNEIKAYCIAEANKKKSNYLENQATLPNCLINHNSHKLNHGSNFSVIKKHVRSYIESLLFRSDFPGIKLRKIAVKVKDTHRSVKDHSLIQFDYLVKVVR